MRCRARLAAGCAALAALLQLLQLLHLSPSVQLQLRPVSSSAEPAECQLSCTPAGPEERHAVPPAPPAPLLPLPARSELLVYASDGAGFVRCTPPAGAVLQLPAGAPRLAHSGVDAGTAARSSRLLAIPDGAWLRAPEQLRAPGVDTPSDASVDP